MQSEREVLLSLYKESKESMRAHAILLVKEGKPISEIAKIFYVDGDTVRSWIKKWDEQKHVEDLPRSGAPEKITEEIEKEISEMVDENDPQKHGRHATSWDCHELRLWVKEKYGTEISDEQLRRILQRNSFRWRKLNYKFIQADEEKRTDFIEGFNEFHEDISETTLIFQDEMASKLHPNQGHIWTKEVKPFIETDCSHEKNYIVGGVAPTTGNTYTVVDEKFNSEIFIQFLRLLLARINGDITLILDNHPSHHSKMVQDFLEDKSRLNLLFLPAYSPDFNPKENFWNYLRMKFLNNKVFKTTKEMAIAVKEFIKKIPKSVVKKICSYEYLLK